MDLTGTLLLLLMATKDPLDALETWARYIATALGVLVIVLPLFQVWLTRHARRDRDSGASPLLTRWPGVLLPSAAFILAGVLLWRPLPIVPSVGWRWFMLLVGIALYFPGIFLYLWAFNTLGAMFGVSTSRRAQLYESHRLVEQGPYGVVRHPMYLGVILAALGAGLIFHTWAMAVFTPCSFVILLRARREDEVLAAKFGEVWREYRDRVPGWVPRITRGKASDEGPLIQKDQT